MVSYKIKALMYDNVNDNNDDNDSTIKETIFILLHNNLEIRIYYCSSLVRSFI